MLPPSGISILAPLAGRDDAPAPDAIIALKISILAPLAGRDLAKFHNTSLPPKFQSSRPLRGATFSLPGSIRRRSYFNPRAPCGARPGHWFLSPPGGIFQSSRPLRGATAPAASTTAILTDFNPRAPCGARPQQTRQRRWRLAISILAPLAGRDQAPLQSLW